MIRTIDFPNEVQLRWDATGAAIWWGAWDVRSTFQIFWWYRPRIVWEWRGKGRRCFPKYRRYFK